MHKIGAEYSEELGETTFSTTLSNGLEIYICKKKGFSKKIGLFGTKYGSVTNDFIDITTNKRVKVPDGIAHFLEHKLFEKEGANALDTNPRALNAIIHDINKADIKVMEKFCNLSGYNYYEI